jgi:lipoate synthase
MDNLMYGAGEKKVVIMKLSDLRYSRLRVFVFGQVMSGTDRKI